MKKLLFFKRVLQGLLLSLISINAMTIPVIAEDIDYSSHFTYEVTNDIAKIVSFKNDITEVSLPEKVTINGIVYEVEKDTLAIGTYLFRSNTCLAENITFPDCYSGIGSANMFRDNLSLKKLVFKYTGDNFRITTYCFRGCIELNEIKIYANSIYYEGSTSNLFRDVPTSVKAYVKNNNVKSSLENANFPGAIIVDPTLGEEVSGVNKAALESTITTVETFLKDNDESKYTNIEALKTTLTTAKTVYENNSATQEDVNNATNSLAAALNAVEVDKTALSNKITEAEELLTSIGRNTHKYTGLNALDTVLFNAKKVLNKSSATVTEVDNEVTALTSALNNVALAGTNKDALLGEINSCKSFAEGKTNTDYENLNNLTSAISSAQSVYNNGDSTQDQIDNAWEKLRAAKESVSKKDTSGLIAEINELLRQAEALNSKDYTKDSWSAVEKAVTEAQAIEDGFVSQYSTALQNLKSAINGLQIKPPYVEEPGDPIAIINKNAVETNLGTFTADESLTGVSKIKITFDCASDVSFNQYASIEVKAMVNGTESYKKFMGTDLTETAGAKGFSIELPLTNPIASGDEISLVAYTWAWANASDYVYGITKIEYMNSVGQILKAVTDRTLALDELKAAITEAEKIEAADYTEDSFAELTTALIAAKELADDSEKADIEAAKTAIEAAVAGLVQKSDNSSSEPTPDSEPDSESTPDSESSSDIESTADSSSKTEEESSSKTDNSSSKTDDSNNSTSSKTDSASSNSKANSANSGTAKSSNPNTGAKATAAGIILLSAIGVIVSRKK